MLNCTGYNVNECNSCLHKLERRVVLPIISNTSTLTVIQTLKRVQKRKIRMTNQLRDWNTPVYFLDDLDHRDIPNHCYEYCTTAEFCKIGSINKAERSMYAVYYANVLLARAALATDIKRLLVIEDDVIFSTSLMLHQMRSIELSLPAVWEYVAIGCSRYKKSVSILRQGMAPCSRVYLLSRDGMKKIAFALPMARPIDYAMPSIFHGCKNVYTLATTPIKHGSWLYNRHRGVDF